MMRKSINRTTVIIVLAIFLSVSVGYALFSDTITIVGTATAQGNFDIEASCTMGYDNDLRIALGLYEEDIMESGYKNESCVIGDNKATINVELEYPGASRAFIVNMKNTGTIDAFIKLHQLLEVVSGIGDSEINLKTTNIVTGEVTNKNYIMYDQDEYDWQFPTLDFIATWVRLEDGTYLVENSDDYQTKSMIYKDSNGNNYLKISPNETLVTFGNIIWDEDAEMQGYTSETKFAFPYEFIQKTSDMVLDPDAEVCLAGC